MNKRQRANRARMRRQLKAVTAELALAYGRCLEFQNEKIRDSKRPYSIDVGVNNFPPGFNDGGFDTVRIDIGFIPTGHTGEAIEGRFFVPRIAYDRARVTEGLIAAGLVEVIRDAAPLLADELAKIVVLKETTKAAMRRLRPMVVLP